MSVSQDLSVLIAQADFRALPPDVAVRIETPMMRYADRGVPQMGSEGKFGFQYTVASALLDGRIGQAVFTWFP
jgi:hypothetical protein